MLEQEVKAVNFDVCKMPHNYGNWLSLQCPLGYSKACISFVIPIHMSTNTEYLVEISLEVAEIFHGIRRFLPTYPKRCSFYPCNLWGYCTDLDQSCKGCSCNIATEHF